MKEVLDLFPESYEDSRARFRASLNRFRSIWPDAELRQQVIAEEVGLTTDWIAAEARERSDKLLVFTTAEHGIEGYVGAAMLQRFLSEFLPRLDPANTGVCFVHAINPWGMKHFRRTNARNVDLNRNFVIDPEVLHPSSNPDYAAIDHFLNPPGEASASWFNTLKRSIQLISLLQKIGRPKFQRATQFGQYQYPKGLFYGGDAVQPETRFMMDLYRDRFAPYAQIVHLDMHTGFGPRYQMSLVNSAQETRTSQELSQAFDYPLVVNTTASEFYEMQGDMIDYVYALVQRDFPEKRLYSTSFEFGTFDESLLGLVRSLFAKIQENRSHFHGTRTAADRARIVGEFRELYYPSEPRWRSKAVADADQALAGILKAERFLS